MVTAVNDVTGDSIRSRASNKAFEEGHDRIFGKKKTLVEVHELVDLGMKKSTYFKVFDNGDKEQIDCSEFHRLKASISHARPQ